MTKPVCLVLGGSGFIGRHVCRELASRGFAVIAMGHGAWSSSEWQTWGVSEWTSCDLSLAAMRSVAEERELDAVIHCAGSGAVSRSYEAPHDDFQRSVASTIDALEFARHHKAGPRVVVASSAAVYGDQGEVDLPETATRSPISPYGYHKLMAELACDSYARFFSVRVSIVRLFSVYGEGLRKQLMWDACRKFRDGNPSFFGTGHEVRDWIHVEDAARLLAIASSADQSGFEVYNGGGHRATTREVLDCLARQSFGAVAPTFTGLSHTGNPRRLTADPGHARRQLGFSPSVALEDGIARYARWFSAFAS